jgi:hypothetical protein
LNAWPCARLYNVRGSIVVAVAAWARLPGRRSPPLTFASREETFEIPKGTWARRMAGNKVEILPSHVYLTVGIRDVLLLKNQDDVPQIFGPTLMMPGQSFRLPFDTASSYQFACTAHASGQMTVVVDEQPNTPWRRLAWRTRRVFRVIT